MSNWTHVAGVIRIDDLRLDQYSTPDFDSLIGDEFDFDDVMSGNLEGCCDNMMPSGSEGSLRKTVYVNPRRSELAAYVVTIFGDLRDHDDPEAIVAWFKEVCSKFIVRQAVITVHNERNGAVAWTYSDSDMPRVKYLD